MIYNVSTQARMTDKLSHLLMEWNHIVLKETLGKLRQLLTGALMGCGGVTGTIFVGTKRRKPSRRGLSPVEPRAATSLLPAMHEYYDIELRHSSYWRGAPSVDCTSGVCNTRMAWSCGKHQLILIFSR
eukprot:TRINITY_DN843_c0_g1_i2.p2 TRINITY_DN843_c0_g1~~TRINITY_DN843_c0_g1_i2.p2  ORF type:complete len:128 (+),score=5.12 TRINITY_DN843_c0_g1_i2:132-515(+)